MALTKHHDLINTDYFGNIRYIRELEIVLGRKLTPLEKIIIEDTFRTLIKVNNEWSNYSNKVEDSFTKNKLELETYIKKYEDTYEKSADSHCIDLYKKLDEWLEDMKEIERRNLDKKCNSIKLQITQVLDELDSINFDYAFNGYFYYKRNPSNHTPRHYVSILEYESGIKQFVEKYNNQIHKEDFHFIHDETELSVIKEIFKTYGELSLYLKEKRYDDSVKAIIMLFKTNLLSDDVYYHYFKTNVEKDITNLQQIAFLIIDKDYTVAHKMVMDFINQNEEWFVRAS